MRHILVASIAVLTLSACGGGTGGSASYDSYEASPSPVSLKSAPQAEMVMDAESSGGTPAPDAGEPNVEQYIAYRHNLGLKLPKGGVEPMMTAHTEACRSAGPATCIVINSNIYSQDENYAQANLSIRATPVWIETFMAGVEGDATQAGGEVTQRSTSAEDLTRQIIDTGARLEAQRTLQGRLLGLLERRDGELGELLQIERELARVTGDIESIEAQLKTLRLRVSMSSLDIGYETRVPAFSGSRENPLGEAFGDFFYNLSAAIAAVVTAFAVGLPWILLIALFLWIWLKLIWPRIRSKAKTKKT